MARNRVIYQSEALYVSQSPAVSGFFTDKTLLVPSAYGETISKIFANGSKDVGEVKNGMPYGHAK